MWSTIGFLLCVLLYCKQIVGDETKVFDVTTIFDIRDLQENTSKGLPGRVHSRTNALGLPLYTYVDVKEKSSKNNITCDSILNVCSWTLSGWFLAPSNLPTYSTITSGEELQLGTFIRFRKKEQDFKVKLKIASDKGLSDCNGYHEIIIGAPDVGLYTTNVKHRYCSCDTNGERIKQVYDQFYGYRYLRCESEYSEYKAESDTVVIKFESKMVTLWDGSRKTKEWSNNKDMRYLHVQENYGGNELLIKNMTGSSYTSVTKGSEMVSPVFTPEDGKLCLVLVFHVPTNIDDSVLDIFSEDLAAERQLLYSVTNALGGWNIRHVNIILTRKTVSTKLVIVTQTNTAVKIARISRYNCVGNEVETISSVELKIGNSPQLLSYETNYTVTAHAVEPALWSGNSSNGNTLCFNGGQRTSGGCACPPGFHGSSCQSGCGRNRFGQDCGGLCSLRQRECEGFLMCSYSTGCHCAPGYQGTTCQEKCQDGYFGNNCQLKCGHCSSDSACDIYTGECFSCHFGYLPPYCNKESVYYLLQPKLSSPKHGIITVTFDPTKCSDVLTPVLYQIQYKIKGQDWKTYITKKFPVLISGSLMITENLEGLRDGIVYQVRVLLMDQDFNKYDGDLVQIAEILTKCDIPEVYNYTLEYESNTSSLNFSWDYVIPERSHWCQLEQYEVSWMENWQWFSELTTKNKFSLENLASGSTILLKVRAKTSGGFFPYSEVVVASTQLAVISRVRNLRAEFRKSSSVEVSWDPPIEGENKQLQYTVSYKCVDRPACSQGCQGASEGQQRVLDTSVIVSPLLPFTQYMITVSAEGGPPASVSVGTAEIVPTEVPMSDQKPIRTNTSVTVFWDEVPVCSSFFLGYNYQLIKESESMNILESGTTNNHSVTFSNLTASTQYIVKVFISTTAGWNPDSFLSVNISTSATVPEAVRNLTVYKRGRGMIGLRWAEPRATYGQLKSFTLTHSLGQDISHTVEPSHCAAWPSLYCHTIEGLRSNRRYNITVSARNSEVPEDGELAFVTAVTKESSPTAPVNLAVTNSSSTSLVLQWEHPDQANGVLRSFLVSIEETEKYDQESCCQVYPLVETSVKEETQKYEAEVSGLHPASTYYVSVSAKTVGLGPSQSLVAYTSPPSLPLTVLPSVQIPSSEISWLPQDKLPDVNNSDVYTSLVKVHLVVAVVTETPSDSLATESGISDPKLDNLLQRKIGKPFYFIAEYTKDDDVDVLSDPIEDQDSVWGHPVASLVPGVKYQLAAAQVLEYNGVYNVDIRYSQPFTL